MRGWGRPSCPGSLLWGLQRLRTGKFGHCGDGQGQGHIPVSKSGASNAPRGGPILAGAGDGDGESPNPYFWPLFWTLKATRSAPAGRRSGGDSTRSSKIHRSWSNPPRWDKGRGGFPIPAAQLNPGRGVQRSPAVPSRRRDSPPSPKPRGREEGAGNHSEKSAAGGFRHLGHGFGAPLRRSGAAAGKGGWQVGRGGWVLPCSDVLFSCR